MSGTAGPGFVPVARIEEVPPGTMLGVTSPDGERICLANCGGEILAVTDECPHQGFQLSVGELSPDGEIECVWHGARFDCRTGAVRNGPADAPLTVYEVRVEEGRIMLGPARS